MYLYHSQNRELLPASRCNIFIVHMILLLSAAGHGTTCQSMITNTSLPLEVTNNDMILRAPHRTNASLQSSFRKLQRIAPQVDDDIFLIVLDKHVSVKSLKIGTISHRRSLSDQVGYQEYFGTDDETNTIISVNSLSESDVKAFEADPKVVSIEKNSVMHIAHTQELTDAGQWGLDRIDSPGAINNKYNYGRDGFGSYVYVVDSGVQITHEDFEGRVESNGKDFIADPINGDMIQNDCNGHGTHVASTVAGKKYGVAKGAIIVPVKVLSCSGSGSVVGIINALAWCADDAVARNVHGIVSMSLGGGFSQALNTATKNVVTRGMIAVVAAGNSNANAKDFSPASTPEAVTVGSTTKSNDSRSSFSNYGPILDIYAPGSDITAAWIGNDNKQINTISGTSMATPHVSGVLAILWAMFPKENNNDIVERLKDIAIDTVTNGNGPQKMLQSMYDESFTGTPTTPTTFTPTSAPTYKTVLEIERYSYEFIRGKFDSNNGPSLPTSDYIHSEIVVADPLDGCQELNGNNYKNRIVLIIRGNCYFTEKIKHAQDKGALAVVIGNNIEGEIPRMIPPTLEEGSKVYVPSISISKKDMNKIIELEKRRTFFGSPPFGKYLDDEEGCLTTKVKYWGNSKRLGKGIRCLSEFTYKGKKYINECITDQRTPKYGKKRRKKPTNYLKKIKGWCFTTENQRKWTACDCETKK